MEKKYWNKYYINIQNIKICLFKLVTLDPQCLEPALGQGRTSSNCGCGHNGDFCYGGLLIHGPHRLTQWLLSSLLIKFAMVLITWKQIAISSDSSLYKIKMSSLLILPSMPLLVNSFNWFFDIGATHYITLDLANLATPDKYCDPDHFCIGNGKALLISHISSTSKPLLFIFIFSIYGLHVPYITKSFLSIHQFCKDKGFFFFNNYYY